MRVAKSWRRARQPHVFLKILMHGFQEPVSDPAQRRPLSASLITTSRSVRGRHKKLHSAVGIVACMEAVHCPPWSMVWLFSLFVHNLHAHTRRVTHACAFNSTAIPAITLSWVQFQALCSQVCSSVCAVHCRASSVATYLQLSLTPFPFAV